MKKIVVSFFVFALVFGISLSAAFAFTTIKVGSKGADVKKVQAVLKAHNFKKVKVDGSYGNSTARYVKLYQRMHHLPADGKVGSKTWKFMMNTIEGSIYKKQLKQPKSELPLRKGAKNDDVKFVQQILKAHGYKVPVDGKFGSKTVKYVKQYQAAHDLHVDGAVGDDTWKSMSVSYKIKPYVWDKAKISRTASRFPLIAASGEAEIAAVKKGLEANIPGLVLHAQDAAGSPVYTKDLDAATVQAVKDFQKLKGWSQTGLVNIPEWEALAATDQDKYYVSLIAKIISMESGGSNENERLAIADCVIDHANASYGGNIEKELKESGRYDPCNTEKEWQKLLKWKAGSQCVDSAKKAYYAGINVFGGKKVYWFHVKKLVISPHNWRWDHAFIGAVDKHVFWGP
jgi:peptidoglycan hydrolase-like protein with peptidoglycan-binding domain